MFYDRFKLLCQRKNISCTKAATEIGLSNSTPTKWKKTAAIPDGSTISRIADYFEVPVEYVMGVSADSQIDEANFRLAELEKELKTATAEEADKIAVEIDGLQESLKDMKFSQPFEENAIRQAKKNNHPAETGRVADKRTQRIFDFVDKCSPEEFADLAKYIDFLEARRTAK